MSVIHSFSVLLAASLLVSFTTSVTACKDDKLCLECKNNACTRCAYSYPNSNGICTAPSKYFTGCYIYGGDGICNECQDGFYHNVATNGNNTCQALNYTNSLYCKYSYFGVNSCGACSNGVLQNGGGCTPGPICADPNCDSCYYDATTGNQYCRSCKHGFAQWGGVNPPVCVLVPELANCDIFFTRNWCARCRPGSYYSNGYCVETSATQYGSAAKLSLGMFVALILAAFRV